MKTLIAEDNFVSRKLIQTILSPYGICDIAVNGREAVDAFGLALEEKQPYDLVCLDIMMPEMDGQDVLKEIRRKEQEMGVDWERGVKIIMTTALNDRDQITQAFKEQCEAYFIKPIDRQRLLDQLKEFGLIEGENFII